MRRADRLPRAAAGGGRGARRRPPRLGLYGFGASAHIVTQVARHLGHEVYVCTRGERAQQFARELGAEWAGGADEPPPVELDSAIIFAPAGRARPARAARGAQGRRGRVRRHPHVPDSRAAIRAAVGRARAAQRREPDARRRPRVPRARAAAADPDEVEEFPLEEANEALAQLKSGELQRRGGARAVRMSRPVGVGDRDGSRRPERMRRGLAAAGGRLRLLPAKPAALVRHGGRPRRPVDYKLRYVFRRDGTYCACPRETGRSASGGRTATRSRFGARGRCAVARWC